MSGERSASHGDRHRLHGITLVVDTNGPEVFIGRCDDISDSDVILLDVDEHREGDGGKSKEEYVAHAAQVGTWTRHQMVTLPRARVVSIRKLGDL